MHSKHMAAINPGLQVDITGQVCAVHYVVTEFGVAYLHGRTIRQRAEALIEIAHPKFRKELYTYCEKMRWLQRPAFQEG
jgi:acyl-CoA hydrolase